jgi:hypothetical protein
MMGEVPMPVPDYYGGNLDALNDCLRDLVGYAYGTTREATGLLLAFAGYDAFARKRPRTAQIVPWGPP